MERISGINLGGFVCPQTVKEGLIRLGHKEGKPRFFLNVVNAVEKENGCIAAVSDSRKMGKAAGY